MGWDGMGWDGMGWDGMGTELLVSILMLLMSEVGGRLIIIALAMSKQKCYSKMCLIMPPTIFPPSTSLSAVPLEPPVVPWRKISSARLAIGMLCRMTLPGPVRVATNSPL